MALKHLVVALCMVFSVAVAQIQIQPRAAAPVAEKMCPCDVFFEPETKCVIEESQGSAEIDRMTCYPLGTDDRNLGQILQETPTYSSTDAISSSPKGWVFEDNVRPRGPAINFAPRVRELRLNLAGNLNINDSDLSPFSNLVNLAVFGGRYRRPKVPHRDYRLTISPGALGSLPKLENIRLADHLQLPQVTLSALEGLKDKLVTFSIWDSISIPPEALSSTISKLGKLKNLDFVNKFAPARCADNMFQGSAATLKRIYLLGCNNTNIPAGMFRGLANLKTLRIADSAFTQVEPGAFDDLVKLEGLHILANKIRQVPTGLFNKLANLQYADFSGGKIENLSEKNFTNSKNFEQLSSAPQCCPCKE